MRHGHALADAGRALLLALEQGVQDLGFGKAQAAGGDLRERDQRLTLGVRTDANRDSVALQQLTDIHPILRMHGPPTPAHITP